MSQRLRVCPDSLMLWTSVDSSHTHKAPESQPAGLASVIHGIKGSFQISSILLVVEPSKIIFLI